MDNMKRYIVQKRINGRYCYYAGFDNIQDAELCFKLCNGLEYRICDRLSIKNKKDKEKGVKENGYKG